MPEVISRKEARDRGLACYFTGAPCKYGHVVERLASASNCPECVRLLYQTPAYKERKRLYMRSYMQGYRQRERR
jgi:hypothetical protein